MGLQSLDSTFVLAAVALPPPLHGQSATNTAVVNFLKQTVRTVVVDIGPREHRSKLGYHVNRVLGVLHAIVLEFRYVTRPNRTLYGVIESGWGRCYNSVMIAAARLLRYNIVLHHHTSAHTLEHSNGFGFLARLAGPLALHVVLGPQMAKDLLNRYPRVRRSLVVHNSAFLCLPPRASQVGSNLPKLTIGFLSNLTNEKGLDSVLNVLRTGRAEGLELELKLAGPAGNTKVREQIESAQREFGPALKVLGAVGPSEKQEFFAGIDLFLFPSRYKFEAQPLVVLEAMSFGVPTIVSRRGYTSEIVGDTGHVVADRSDLVASSVEICRRYVNGCLSLSSQGSRSRERFVTLRHEGQSGLSSLQELVVKGRAAAWGFHLPTGEL